MKSSSRTDINKYVATLDEDLQRVYKKIHIIRLTIRDTLSDEFQIVCELDDVFDKYASARCFPDGE